MSRQRYTWLPAEQRVIDVYANKVVLGLLSMGEAVSKAKKDLGPGCHRTRGSVHERMKTTVAAVRKRKGIPYQPAPPPPLKPLRKECVGPLTLNLFE